MLDVCCHDAGRYVARLSRPLWVRKYFRAYSLVNFHCRGCSNPWILWSTNLTETFSRNLNGPDRVTSDLTSAGEGKKKGRKDEYSCFVEVFPPVC